MSQHPKPWHKHSTFSQGYRHPLDRERRAQWKARVKLNRRAGPLTAAHEDVAECLPRYLGQDGRCDPAHETLATASGYCVNTVKEALKRLARCGLLTWVQRIVRDGNSVRQTSNSYMLMLGDPPRFQAVRCEATTRRENPEESFIPMASADEVAKARAVMAERRAAAERKLLNKGTEDGRADRPTGQGRIDEETLRRLRANCAERRG